MILSIATLAIGIPSCIYAVYLIYQTVASQKNSKKLNTIEVKGSIHQTSDTRQSFDNNVTGYSNVLQISDFKFPYIPLIASWDLNQNEYRIAEIKVKLVDLDYSIPEEFIRNFDSKDLEYKEHTNEDIIEPKVRLLKYNIEIRAGQPSNVLLFTFSKIHYRDFLITNNVLDDIIPGCGQITFRQKYFPDNKAYDPETGCLSNICGVGVFIITSDNKIIVREASSNVTVGANRLGYSASGTMDWKNDTNPFREVMRECYEEIRHPINIDNLFLFSFGLDTEKAYYQFSFYERSPKTAQQILIDSPMARDFAPEIKRLFAIDFEYISIIENLYKGNWDGSSAAALMTLCSKFFGKKRVEEYINPSQYNINYKNQMKIEWDLRAEREGKLAVLSNRFPMARLDQISNDYINQVLNFIDRDIQGKNILEVGCGIGLQTKYFVQMAGRVTCLDISSKMLQRNKLYLGEDSAKVIYNNCFLQDFNSNKKYDAIISSLVLIHNTSEDAIHQMTDKMTKLSDVIFLFEQVDTGIQNSIHSNAKKIKDYLEYFEGYNVVKQQEHFLFTDTIVFLKLVRKSKKTSRNKAYVTWA